MGRATSSSCACASWPARRRSRSSRASSGTRAGCRSTSSAPSHTTRCEGRERERLLQHTPCTTPLAPHLLHRATCTAPLALRHLHRLEPRPVGWHSGDRHSRPLRATASNPILAGRQRLRRAHAVDDCGRPWRVRRSATSPASGSLWAAETWRTHAVCDVVAPLNTQARSRGSPRSARSTRSKPRRPR